MSTKLLRRRFLTGAGTLLALPFLESSFIMRLIHGSNSRVLLRGKQRIKLFLLDFVQRQIGIDALAKEKSLLF